MKWRDTSWTMQITAIHKLNWAGLNLNWGWNGIYSDEKSDLYVLDEHGSQTNMTEIKSFFKMKAAAIYISN